MARRRLTGHDWERPWLHALAVLLFVAALPLLLVVGTIAAVWSALVGPDEED